MAGLVAEIGSQLIVLGICPWNTLSPYLTFECATLPLNSPKGALIGQMSGVNDGPVGLSCKSNQNPYLSEPAA